MAGEREMTPEEAAAFLRHQRKGLDQLRNIRMRVSIELGRRKMQLSDVLNLKTQEVIELDKLAGEAFDVRVNDQPFAKGEIVVVTDMMTIRLTQMQHLPYSMTWPQPDNPVEADEEQTSAGDVAGEDEQTETNTIPDKFIESSQYIPAGPFVMGGRDEDSPRPERPAHTVYLSAFRISRFPVTNVEYGDFVQSAGHRAPIHWQRGTFPAGTGKHPVVNVSWQDARDYAEWRGVRLPTEAEWEKAARGTDERPYPWGTRFTEGERCNANNQIGTTTPVDEYVDGRSFYEVWDMAGNVYEWCQDYFDEEYYKSSPASNPKGPGGRKERVIRGGSYQETRAALRTTHRMGASEVSTRDNIGFRLASDG